MRAFIVQTERNENLGVYFEEKRALDVKSLHEKRHPHGYATITTFDLDSYELFVLYRDGLTVGVYSTLDNVKAAASALDGDCGLGSFILDAPPLGDESAA